MLWPSIVIGSGVVLLSAGSYLLLRLHARGVPARGERLTREQWMSGGLMLWGWSLVGVGLVWLLLAAAWKLAG